MSQPTALYVEVPAAAAVLRAAGAPRWRLRRPAPPHVTVLWPFLPLDAVDAQVHLALAEVVGAQPSFSVRFDRSGRFGDLHYLAPRDPEPFRRLTHALARRWPDLPPYGGEFDTVIPHLTVGAGPRAGRVCAAALAAPIELDVTAVHLAVERRWRGWTTLCRVPLGPTTS